MNESLPEQGVSGAAADVLVDAAGRDGTAPAGGYGELRKEISNAMVALKKQLYGKGPTKSKTFINDNIVFCVLDGGLTRNEETLLAAGEEQLIRSYRLRFQEVVEETSTTAIERITGRKVLTYHSQIVFDPHMAFEIFVLDAAP
jgi:uncharacterized protein YbcI